MRFPSTSFSEICLLLLLVTSLAGCGGGGDPGPNEEELRYSAIAFAPTFVCDPATTRLGNTLPVANPTGPADVAGDYCTSGFGGHTVGFSLTTAPCQLRVSPDGSATLQIGSRALRTSAPFSRVSGGVMTLDSGPSIDVDFLYWSPPLPTTSRRLQVNSFRGQVVQARVDDGHATLVCEFGRTSPATGSAFSNQRQIHASAIDFPTAATGTFAGTASGLVAGVSGSRSCTLNISTDGAASLTAPLLDFSGELKSDLTYAARLDGDQYDGIGLAGGTIRKVWFFDTPDISLYSGAPMHAIYVIFDGLVPRSARGESRTRQGQQTAVCNF